MSKEQLEIEFSRLNDNQRASCELLFKKINEGSPILLLLMILSVKRDLQNIALILTILLMKKLKKLTGLTI